jgi:hypothetical protein
VRGRLFPTDSEWCEWRQDPALPVLVMVRVGAGADGRLVLTGLRIEGEPTADLLRSIPVGRIEAAANAQLVIVDDAVLAAQPAASLQRPRRRAHTAPAGGRQRDASGWETSDPGRAVSRPPAGRASGAVIAQPTSPDPRRGRPDDFYRQVAQVYLDLAQVSIRPAADLAEANEVPVTTAHRWIKEARRRGFLPPGRPGKSG